MPLRLRILRHLDKTLIHVVDLHEHLVAMLSIIVVY